MARLPRVYLIRHSETEWSMSGQHTGKTDIPLTANGEKMMKSLAKEIVGPGKLLCPRTISHIFISPRRRAQKTFEILFSGLPLQLKHVEPEICEDVQEWDYGDYEGKTSDEIRKMVPDWDIWTQGCPNGETPRQITERVDRVVERVSRVHREYWNKVQSGQTHPDGDCLIITHGHFSKCFLARWCELQLDAGRIFVVDAGGISIGGYQHRDLREKSLLWVNASLLTCRWSDPFYKLNQRNEQVFDCLFEKFTGALNSS